MKNELIIAGLCILLAGLSFHLGTIMKDSTKVKVYGVWLPQLKQVENYDGRFICINIDETKTLKQLINTCEHEVGHEIFARECAANITKCLEIEK